MTAQPELEFPSAPLDADTRATVELVGHDWRSDHEWMAFEHACRVVDNIHDEVDPNKVRWYLTDFNDELTINPRRLSAFYNRAAGKDGFLEFSHWGISTDKKGRNAGKPCKIWKLRAGA